MKKYEYQTFIYTTKGFLSGGKVDGDTFNEALNNLGRDGWDLIKVVDTNHGTGTTESLVCIFKREME